MKYNLLSVLAVAGSLAACGGGSSPTNKPSTPTGPVSQQKHDQTQCPLDLAGFWKRTTDIGEERAKLTFDKITNGQKLTLNENNGGKVESYLVNKTAENKTLKDKNGKDVNYVAVSSCVAGKIVIENFNITNNELIAVRTIGKDKAGLLIDELIKVSDNNLYRDLTATKKDWTRDQDQNDDAPVADEGKEEEELQEKTAADELAPAPTQQLETVQTQTPAEKQTAAQPQQTKKPQKTPVKPAVKKAKKQEGKPKVELPKSDEVTLDDGLEPLFPN